MYDAVFVLVEAFNKLLKKKPDQFRSYTMRRSSSQHSSYTNSSYGNLIANGQNTRVLDCNTAKGWINPWEHGDKISRYLRKVRSIQCAQCSVCLYPPRSTRCRYKTLNYIPTNMTIIIKSYYFASQCKCTSAIHYDPLRMLWISCYAVCVFFFSFYCSSTLFICYKNHSVSCRWYFFRVNTHTHMHSSTQATSYRVWVRACNLTDEFSERPYYWSYGFTALEKRDKKIQII